MIMKKIACLFVIALAIVCARAQTPALNLLAWNATVTVLDEAGQPVADADVEMSYYVPPPPGEREAGGSVHSLADTNGVVRLSHANNGSIGLGFHVTKAGYYPTTKGHEFAKFQDNDPAKWNPNETLVLKKIGQPIAMYAKKEDAKMPKENKPVGFDLMAGDWVAPDGTGKTADLLFTVHRKITSPQEFDADLKLTFPNAGDGVVVVPPAPDTGSPLVMPRPAPEGGYQAERQWRYHNFSERPESVLGYFFRVRTVLDENGNVKSALYGKIQGDVRFLVGTKAPRAGIAFDYYLNPTSNSRNVEFDPGKNLFNNLEPVEEIKAP